MSDNKVTSFKRLHDNDRRRIIYCTTCDSRMMKLTQYEGDDTLMVECANCEQTMTDLVVVELDDD